MLSILTASSIAFAGQANAMESPLKKISDFSKEKLKNVRMISVGNGRLAKNNANKAPNYSAEKDEAVNKSHIEQVEEAAEFASQKTGVRKDFLLGMLVVESDLGRKTGECSYGEVEEGALEAYSNGQLSYRAYNTFIGRREIVKDLARKLDYEYENMQVSCNPERYAGTGGAMGIGQFMPDTWMLFQDKVGEIVGKETPDPWDIRDGVVAMALLLADTQGVTEHDYYAERNAAKMYLSGTTSYQYEWYANQIMYWAQNHRRITG